MKKNKPRWKNLDMWERLARRCKQNLDLEEDEVGSEIKLFAVVDEEWLKRSWN